MRRGTRPVHAPLPSRRTWTLPRQGGTDAVRLTAEPLTAVAFAPFGEVLEGPEDLGRRRFEAALANWRPGAWPSLSLTRKAPLEALPLRTQVMERHRFSSQSFVPMATGRWLAIVAPHAAGGGPDMARARAFIARSDQGVTYGADVWHHPLVVLDHVAHFAVLVWRDGTAADDEFVDVAPFTVDLP